MEMDARTQTMGVRVSISRTITPAKYTAETAYSTTGWGERGGEEEGRDEGGREGGRKGGMREGRREEG